MPNGSGATVRHTHHFLCRAGRPSFGYTAKPFLTENGIGWLFLRHLSIGKNLSFEWRGACGERWQPRNDCEQLYSLLSFSNFAMCSISFVRCFGFTKFLFVVAYGCVRPSIRRLESKSFDLFWTYIFFVIYSFVFIANNTHSRTIHRFHNGRSCVQYHDANEIFNLESRLLRRTPYSLWNANNSRLKLHL